MHMLVTAVRVFGTEDEYGGQFVAPPDGPIEVQDWPTKGDVSRIDFGAVPQWLLEAVKTRRAIGMLYLQVFRRSPETAGMTPIEAIEHFRQSGEASFPFGRARWCTTVSVQRGVDVANDGVSEHKYHWLSPSAAGRLEAEVEAWSGSHLERLASAVAATGNASLLTDILHSGVYFSADGRCTFGMPRFTGGGSAYVTRQMSSFPFASLQAMVQRMARTPRAKHAPLDSVRHWLLEARAERDPWKKFLWSVLALEILARKAGKALYPEMLGRLNMAAVPETGASGIIELIPPHDRQTLVGCFATMSLVLSPTTAGDDIASFKKVKQFRDGMAHGSLRAQADLPVTETDSLLQRYFQLAAARLLAPEA